MDTNSTGESRNVFKRSIAYHKRIRYSTANTHLFDAVSKSAVQACPAYHECPHILRLLIFSLRPTTCRRHALFLSVHGLWANHWPRSSSGSPGIPRPRTGIKYVRIDRQPFLLCSRHGLLGAPYHLHCQACLCTISDACCERCSAAPLHRNTCSETVSWGYYCLLCAQRWLRSSFRKCFWPMIGPAGPRMLLRHLSRCTRAEFHSRCKEFSCESLSLHAANALVL